MSLPQLAQAIAWKYLKQRQLSRNRVPLEHLMPRQLVDRLVGATILVQYHQKRRNRRSETPTDASILKPIVATQSHVPLTPRVTA
jgi:hypothetical protein